MKRCLALLLCVVLLSACAAPGEAPPATSGSPEGTPCPGETGSPAPEAVTASERCVIDGNIIHAGGRVDGYTTTNSLEAVEAAAAAGERFIEIDFSLTADGESVCLHDWNEGYLPGFEKSDFPLTLAEFAEQKIYGELTPLTLSDLASWLKEHPEVYIITDVKEGDQITLQEIAGSWPELRGRFIPQIYGEAELETVRSLGFENVIYTLYLLPWEEKLDTDRVGAFARDNGLAGITFDWTLTEQPGYVDALLAWDVPLFTHTLNDPEVIASQLAMGITGVYTDNVG